jgi:hypothetical protein
MSRVPSRRGVDPADLLGWSRLAFDATLGLTGVVEAMHRAVTRLPGSGPGPSPDRTRGLTGLVYGGVRGITRLAGHGVGLALARVGKGLRDDGPARTGRQEAILAALNGVLGDHLAAEGNPLAIPMRLRRDGSPLPIERDALRAALPGAGSRPLVLVHGSCMNDLRWLRDGHDHGAALARDLGFTPLYLHYNSGLHVSTNGRELAGLLEALQAEWPVPLEGLTLVAHSMGGLVARSACHHAAAAGQAWLGHLTDAVFLGTPHHGAPLERGGSWVDAALGVSRHTAPLARLGKIRSAGVTDLRHGSVLDEDWRGRDRFARSGELPRVVPLPRGVRCHAVAGSTARGGAVADRLVGDGLVPVDSALGIHADPSRDLGFPEDRRFVGRGLSHVELLSSREVYGRIAGWLGG